MNDITQNTFALDLVKLWYGDKVAERSQVPLINHIHEGLKILDSIGANKDTKDAFCLHPLFQNNKDLCHNWHMVRLFNQKTIALVMEYRNIANRSLSDNVAFDPLPGVYVWQGVGSILSPIPDVNKMLIADKVQNRADFEIYHKGKHERSNELDFYFKYWLNALGINEDKYQELVKIAKE